MADYMINNGELQHYGVLGMKWGVRRARKQYANATTKAERKAATNKLNAHMAKANEKLKKLDKKVDRAEALARKRKGQADAAEASFLISERRTEKHKNKARKASAKAAVRIRKAERWYNSMEKTFANTNVSMTSEQIAKGKRYKERMNMRSLTY